MNGDTAQMLTDTVQSYGALTLRCRVQLPGRSLVASLSLLRVHAASVMVAAKQKLNAIFASCLSVSKNNH